MAHGTARPRRDQERVLVAIGPDLVQVEEVAGTLALFPQPLLTAAEENDPSLRQRFPQGLAIHVAHHQDRTRVGVLNHGWDEARALAEIQQVQIAGAHRNAAALLLARIHGRTSIPAARNARFSSVITIAPEWNTLAASAASTPARLNTSAK